MGAYDNPCIELYPKGKRLTGVPTIAVVGKRFIKVTADRANNMIQVGPCTAGAKAFGVAANDAAIGESVGTFGPGDVVPVTCGATVASGIEVESDAAGKAIPLATGKACGYSIQGAANNADAEIRLY